MSGAGGGSGRIVAFVPDLMDRSKVRAAAAAGGRTVELVARPGDLLAALGPEPPGLVLIDLSRPGALEALTGVARAGTVRVLAFGSHVDRELLASGRAAGAEVLARSELFRRLPELLADP